MTAVKDIRPGLRAYLLADGAIAALIGPRMFPSILPQGINAPSLVYQRISGFGDHHMQGPSGYAVARVQVRAWSLNLETSEGLANLVKGRLDGFRGTFGSGPTAVRVLGIFYEQENPPDFDTGRSLHGIGRDYMIHYQER